MCIGAGSLRLQATGQARAGRSSGGGRAASNNAARHATHLGSLAARLLAC